MALLSLIAKLGLDKTGFDAGLNAAQSKVGNFASNLKGQLAAAFGVAAITAYAKHLVDLGSEINDNSKKASLSAEEYQSLGYAMKQSGSDATALIPIMKALSIATAEALSDPKSDAAKVFNALGIGADKLRSSRPAEIFRQIGDAFKSIDFKGGEGDMVSKILGKGGVEALAAFNDGIRETEAEFQRLGLAIDPDTIEKLDKIGDALVILKKRGEGVFAPLLASLAEVVEKAEKSGFLKFVVGGAKAGANAFSSGFKANSDQWEKEKAAGVNGFSPFRVFAAGIKGAFSGFMQETLDGIANDNEAKKALDEFEQNLLFNSLLGGHGIEGGGKRAGQNPLAGPKESERAAARSAFSVQSDSLGRIGGTVGGSGVQDMASAQRSALNELRMIRRVMEIRGIKIQDLN